jgi:hypothetical protein
MSTCNVLPGNGDSVPGIFLSTPRKADQPELKL